MLTHHIFFLHGFAEACELLLITAEQSSRAPFNLNFTQGSGC